MVLTPTPATLKKYGLSEPEWKAMLDEQGGVCYVCEQEPKKGRLVIDHYHAKGWRKMPPEQRKLFVRGLLCWWCNSSFLGRGITTAKARNVVRYLERYEAKRGNIEPIK
jgi:hypothetical protein